MFLELWNKDVHRVDWKTVKYDEGMDIIMGFLKAYPNSKFSVRNDSLRKIVTISNNDYHLNVKCTCGQSVKVMELSQ